MSTVAYVDARAGIAGDMFLGALVDAGLPMEVLGEVVEALGLDDVEVVAKRVRRGPLVATKVDVLVGGEVAEAVPGHLAPCTQDAHRTLGGILEVVRGAKGLGSEALADAVRAFGYLAAAEARVHGSTVETVHFHEVGAADALVDVVGTCVGLRRLGVTEVRVGALPWSTGTMGSAHGSLPLPPPAVMHLLEGHPTFPSGEEREQVTPTGAALVKALSRGTTVMAGFVPRRTGMGAGTHEGEHLPNVVRLTLGEASGEATPTAALCLEANLDDATGQEAARALARSLEEGALDAWVAPVTMKKGRPGLVLSLLVRPGDERRFEALLFEETPTLGVRRHAVARTVLARRHVMVSTPYGEVRMKVRETPGGPCATPEHDDALRLAEHHGVALGEVLDAARLAWARPT